MSARTHTAARCWKSATTSPARAPTIVRRAPALTKFDAIDTAIARRFAKERLAALPARTPPSTPEVAPEKPHPAPSSPRKVALIVGNGAYKNVERLANPPRDAKLIASTLEDLGFATVTLAPDLTRDKFFAALQNSARGRKRPIGRWSIMPVTAWRSAGSTI